MKFVSRLSLFPLAALSASLALAQPAGDFPNRPLKIIVPNAAGGPADLLARLAGASMQQRYGQPVVVENRPGASGQIATEAVVKSPADGYTLLLASSGTVAEEVLGKDWPFRVERDFTPITIFAGGALVLAATSSLPVNNLRELIAYTKANPGKLNQGESGSVSPSMAILSQLSGMGPTEIVIYKTTPATQLVAGEVQIAAINLGSVAQLEKAGKVKFLAYFGRPRHPAIPHVPTVAEHGGALADFDIGFWFGLFGPAGVPSAATGKVNAAVNEMLKTSEFAEKTASYGYVTFSFTPEQSRDKMMALYKLFKDAAAAGVLKR